MKTRFLSVSCAALSSLTLALMLGTSGCSKTPNNLEAEAVSELEKHVSKTDPNPLRAPEKVIPADLIAYAGHGAIYDAGGKPIKLNSRTIARIQTSMIEQLWKPGLQKMDKKLIQRLEEAKKLSTSRRIRSIDRRLLQNGVIAQLLKHVPHKLKVRYDWRHRLLLTRTRDAYVARRDRLPRLVAVLLDDLQIRNIFDSLILTTNTDYVQQCKEADVPIPPPWTENSTSWKYHGLLTEKLIASTSDAHVWTYAAHHQRGGCIALPRGSGTGTSLAGIICQSATTGKACFWDNIRRNETANFGWKNQTLDVNQMRDGDSLAENCTGCHRGNNVFNISPDDATWQKVINPVSQSSVGSTFTTNIENTSVARYIPISSQTGWDNPQAAQCIGCHERPSVGFSPPAVMPPACANGSTSSPSGCYN